MKTVQNDSPNPAPGYVPPGISKEKSYNSNDNKEYIIKLGLCEPGQEKEFCKGSKMGLYKCSVFIDSSDVFCDACLRSELLYLKSQGVKTTASCCGHGDINKSSIIVESKKSIKKMYELGYKKKPWKYETETKAMYYPKTKLIYEE